MTMTPPHRAVPHAEWSAIGAAAHITEVLDAAARESFFPTLVSCLTNELRASSTVIEWEGGDGGSPLPVMHVRDSLMAVDADQTGVATANDGVVRLSVPGDTREQWVRVAWRGARVDASQSAQLVTALARPVTAELRLRALEARLLASEQARSSAEEQNAQLREEHRQLELVLDGTRLGFWDWHPVTNTVTFDERWAEMLGYELWELEPCLATWETRVHPDDLAACYADLAAHLDGRKPYYENVHRMRHRDGRWVHILDRGKIMERAADGTALRFCGTHTDISVQKEAERVAVEATLAKSRFLANMSHELRTPLTAVLGLSGALLEGTFGPLLPKQHHLLLTVEESGRHLLDLINDMLDIARVDSGALALTVAPISLAKVIDQTLAMTLPLVEAKQQVVTVALDPATDHLRADARRLKQVLANLVVNASKFSPAGSSIRVESSVAPHLGQLSLFVRDSGIGVDPADHERIFEPFVMLEDAPTRAHTGVGLGLSLVKRLVSLHGGSVHVESAPGSGATFIVRLPWSHTDAVQVAQDTKPRAPLSVNPQRNHVLLVEDSEVVTLVVESYLTAQGFRVTVAQDGAQGIQLGRDPSVDVVLMDMALPHVDGLTAMRSIRECRPQLPIIALTAHAHPNDEARCLEAGADVFLSKPVDLHRLAETILVITADESDVHA